jgi:DNA-directed RNA polymerase specialized sigma24 family protein
VSGTRWRNCKKANFEPPVKRYGKAITSYLTAALRDPDAAEELSQEFALSLLKGEFRQVTPEKGRFRNYVKTVLFHLVSKYRKRRQKQPRQLESDSPALQSLAAPAEADPEFGKCWRDELLARTWDALAQVQPALEKYRNS